MVARRVYTHWATSKDISNLNLTLHDAGSGLEGRALGVCHRGDEFVFDSFAAYAAGLVTNPNMVLAGSIGVGKSTLVKMLLARGLAEGRTAVVIDPKGEYGALAEQCGVKPVTFGRDGWCNPFVGDDEENQALLRRMVAATQGRELSALQRFQLSQLWRECIDEGEQHIFQKLFDGVEQRLSDAEESPSQELALLLHRFVRGDLRGLFDGPGEPLSLSGDLVILDLSQQWAGDNVALVAMSAVAAAQHTLVARSTPGYLVLDESWTLLRDPGALKWLQGSWKLARSRGISHVLVLHRWSDIASAGDQGSAQRERAAGLLRECETSWLFRQGEEEANEMASVIGLNAQEQVVLTNLPKGTALVRYAQYRSIVAIQPDAQDQAVVDTDQAML